MSHDMVEVLDKGLGNHLQSFNFLKKGDTTDLGYGFVAKHVGKFSGCSIHSLCNMPLDFSFSERFTS